MSAKLTAADVAAIRDAYFGPDRVERATLARQYGVSSEMIRRIVHGLSWVDADGPTYSKGDKRREYSRAQLEMATRMWHSGASLSEMRTALGRSLSHILPLLPPRSQPLHSKASLTTDQAKELRELYATGRYTMTRLADFYGLKSTAAVGAIVRGETYKSAGGPTCKDNRRYIKTRMGELNDVEVIKIRRMYATGRYSQHDLAHHFDVTQPWISAIVRGEAYPYLPGPRVRQDVDS